MATVSKLIAPVAPFYADRLYQDLDKTTQKEQCSSVHLAYFPDVNSAFIDPKLEQKMQRAQRIVSLVLSIRKKEKIKVRQPLQRVLIPVLDAEEKREIEEISALIAAEVNVKSIEILDDASSILVKEIKPNFKTLGPRFGKDMKLISNAIQKLQEKDIKEIEEKGVLEIEINGKSVRLQSGDVEITSQDIEGWLVANQGSITVYDYINDSRDKNPNHMYAMQPIVLKIGNVAGWSEAISYQRKKSSNLLWISKNS